MGTIAVERPRFKSIDDFLALLQGVEKHGQGKWKALCPAHYDTNPSLSITLKGNKILVKCLAGEGGHGCPTPQVMETLGLKMSHLFIDDGSKPPRSMGPSRIVATYVYVDEANQHLYRKLRKEPKDFVLERYDPKAKEWIGGKDCMKGVRRVLFDLPKVKESGMVFWVEGEKDAINTRDKLCTKDMAATTCVEGAGSLKKWNPEYAETLRGKEVVLVPDRDVAGIHHMLFIAARLQGIAKSVKILLLPKPYKDISDWAMEHDQHQFLTQLLWLVEDFTVQLASDLVKEYPEPEKTSTPHDAEVGGGDGDKPSEDKEADEGMPTSNTDTGNAIRLVRLFGDRLRFCYETKHWYVWTDQVWQPDMGALINQYATKTVKSIYVEAANEPDKGRAKELARHAIQSESNHRIVAMIARAESQPGIPITPQELDKDNWLLNCANGTIDLRIGKLLPHTKEHYITHIIPTKYDPDAKCPIWDKFLERVMNNDKELIAYLQKCVGYSLTGDTRTELVFFVFGEGQNGKSTFIGTIRVLLGCYAHRVSPDVFMQMKGKGSSGPKESLANLRGKRFVAASEIEEGRRLHMALVKSLTGAESIIADRKYEHEIEYQPTHHLWLSGNYRPEVRDDSIAAWRRLKVVPFTVHIPDQEKDETLKFRLLDELEGILAWAVRGCLAYQQDGLKEPDAVKTATSEYRKEQDILGSFMDECCIIDPSSEITNKGFRLELKAWCGSSNLEPLNTWQIKRLLTGKGFMAGVSSDGKHRVWKGLRLRELTDPVPPETPPDKPTEDPAKQPELLSDTDKIAGEDPKADNTDKIRDSDKSEPHIPRNSLIKEKQKRFRENTPTSVKLSKDDGDYDPYDDRIPQYPTGPCRCGCTNFWLRADGGAFEWLCKVCKPQPIKGKVTDVEGN